MKTLKIFISGIVQGVFFRRFVKEQADKLGLKGYVRNLEDSRVEVVIEGDDKQAEEMIKICKKGSPHSKINKTEVEKIENRGFKEFKILRD